jgi:hypothetical protein
LELGASTLVHCNFQKDTVTDVYIHRPTCNFIPKVVSCWWWISLVPLPCGYYVCYHQMNFHMHGWAYKYILYHTWLWKQRADLYPMGVLSTSPHVTKLLPCPSLAPSKEVLQQVLHKQYESALYEWCHPAVIQVSVLYLNLLYSIHEPHCL